MKKYNEIRKYTTRNASLALKNILPNELLLHYSFDNAVAEFNQIDFLYHMARERSYKKEMFGLMLEEAAQRLNDIIIKIYAKLGT